MSGGQPAWATLCVTQVVGSEHVPGIGTCSARRLQRRLTGELALPDAAFCFQFNYENTCLEDCGLHSHV